MFEVNERLSLLIKSCKHPFDKTCLRLNSKLIICLHKNLLKLERKSPIQRLSRKTNKIGTNAKWVPKDKIIYLVGLLNDRKETPVTIPTQWILTMHKRRKVYVPTPKEEKGKNNDPQRKPKRKDSRY